MTGLPASRLARLLTLLLGLALTACHDEASVTITNQSPQSVPLASVTITGRVQDSAGQPVAGAVIALAPYGRTATDVRDGQGRRTADTFVTDAQGRYTIANQPAASYTLHALASGYAKATRSIAVDQFAIDTLVNGQIVRDFTLQALPAQNNGDLPPVALFDIEDKKRMTELLTSYGIRYQSLVGRLNELSTSTYKVLVIGHDATVYSGINELLAQSARIEQFINDGGHVIVGQLNDFSFENTPLTFLGTSRSFMLHTENAPFNDFDSGVVKNAGHPLLANVGFSNWSFIEPGQLTVKHNVTFDAIVGSSLGSDWQILATAPATPFSNNLGTVPAEADVIVAEYVHPTSGGRVVLNQGAYYQGSFGNLTDANAIALTANMVAYLKQLNSTP